VVAIDGPAGAGKSTVARRLAEELGFVLVDTGAMYRTVALLAIRQGVNLHEGAALGEIAARLVRERALVFERDPRGVRVKVVHRGEHGPRETVEDVSEAIRTPEVALAASVVSAHPEVRLPLLDLQRQAGAEGGVVLEGRDIGTVVFPDAEAKVFLTASPATRAARRFAELQARGQTNDDGSPVTLEQLEGEMQRRDSQDVQRAVAPLRQADGALVLDCTALGVDEIVARLRAFVLSRGASKTGGEPR
jgi:cytidylate kinase